MASVNKAILVGHLGKDPETRYAPSGEAICNITLATSESWRDKATGEKREATEWHRVAFFGKLAEIAGQYLRKGAAVYIEGSIRTRKWKDKDGQDRHSTEIRADVMKMLGGRQDGSDNQARGDAGSRSAPPSAPPPPQGRAPYSPPPAGNSNGGGFGDFDDDIPFNKVGAGRQYLVI